MEIIEYLDESFWEWLLGERDLWGMDFGNQLVLDIPSKKLNSLKWVLGNAILRYLQLTFKIPSGGLGNVKEPISVGKAVLWKGSEKEGLI